MYDLIPNIKMLLAEVILNSRNLLITYGIIATNILSSGLELTYSPFTMPVLFALLTVVYNRVKLSFYAHATDQRGIIKLIVCCVDRRISEFVIKSSTSLKSPPSEKKRCYEDSNNERINSIGNSSPGPSGASDTTYEENGQARITPNQNSDVTDDCVNGRKRRFQQSSPSSDGKPLFKKPCFQSDRTVNNKDINKCDNEVGSTKYVLAHVVTSKERQFKWAIRLYRYLNTKNAAFDLSARSRIFLKRNLVYMSPKACSVDSKTGIATLGPPVKRRRTPTKTFKQRLDNLLSVVDRIYADRRKRCGFGSPSDRVLGSLMTRTDLSNTEFSCGSLKNSEKSSNGFSQPTAVMKFIDVRNKDLPGSRRAKITVHIASEIDGVFGEIRRLQAATTFMQVNVKRNKPIGIDLPVGIGTLVGKQTKRNDYVILRVTFSEEENAKISGGRTLRCVPSRQAENVDTKVVKVTRRSSNRSSIISAAAASPSSSNDDALVMYGARCVASVSSGNKDSGVLYGDGSINLVPSEWLGSRNGLGRDGSNAKKLLELGKKNHTGPFIKIIVASDAGEESSSSEEDEETKSCSTSCFLISRSTSVCSNRGKITHNSMPNEISPSVPVDDSFQTFLKARYKRDLSLQFPKEIW
uniref:VEFS-Box domain-containing protein n=1 Tax=Syphacia muris TaxID=451379 RepID=A0A0N5AW40_9BILA